MGFAAKESIWDILFEYIQGHHKNERIFNIINQFSKNKDKSKIRGLLTTPNSVTSSAHSNLKRRGGVALQPIDSRFRKHEYMEDLLQAHQSNKFVVSQQSQLIKEQKELKREKEEEARILKVLQKYNIQPYKERCSFSKPEIYDKLKAELRELMMEQKSLSKDLSERMLKSGGVRKEHSLSSNGSKIDNQGIDLKSFRRERKHFVSQNKDFSVSDSNSSAGPVNYINRRKYITSLNTKRRGLSRDPSGKQLSRIKSTKESHTSLANLPLPDIPSNIM
jgi:hypothetical protein